MIRWASKAIGLMGHIHFSQYQQNLLQSGGSTMMNTGTLANVSYPYWSLRLRNIGFPREITFESVVLWEIIKYCSFVKC